ncbi:DNA binding protein [Odocoileus adenovirus 1]|uniref:DNA binding protein n=2 Tax=Deer atadenovirus A TaxID=2169706 RepID=A0A223PZ84_9ADEN|nr:DNA binding protein [Odocoileus adenovirus 1]ASU50644.1 DNA binding protein [Odocoileus adenovirus 1]QEM20942.1 DNA binding protein [Deer atadenovirus A]UNU90952.1 DNA binding protein [Deer atadenovirus A]UWT50603.1 DNA binding protein [Deer atadenovirus A]
MSARKGSKSSKKGRSEIDEMQQKMQAALEILAKFGDFVKVDTTQMKFNPEEGDCEKLFSQYLKKMKTINLIYSTTKSMGVVGGRMLYSAICKQVSLNPNFNASGCYLWYNDWSETRTRCFHGDFMFKKVNEIEMAPTSDMGAQALKEGRGIICSGRMNKQVVKVIQENYVICAEDAQQRFGQCSSKSCGLNFSDEKKALTAMQNALETTKAVFPNAKVGNMLFILGQCECNYGGKIITGKQLPKITAYSITGLEGIDVQDVPKVQAAAILHPVVFVFQCCNYQYSNKRNSGRFCEMKISLPDLLQCLTLVRKFWFECMGMPLPIQFPQFKWSQCFQVKNTVLPMIEEDVEANPFGDIEEPPQPSQKKRRTILDSSSEDEEEEEED